MTDLKKPLKEELFPIQWSPAAARAMRKELGLTQGDVASYLGVCKCTVRKFESGDSVSPTMMLAYGSFLERYSFYVTKQKLLEEDEAYFEALNKEETS